MRAEEALRWRLPAWSRVYFPGRRGGFPGRCVCGAQAGLGLRGLRECVWQRDAASPVATMSGSQNNDMKRQFLLERLLDAVKQCQIRFGGRKEIASDSDSRVTCLCAQFEAVLQHGLRRSRGLALTAAAIKQAAGFSSKTETEPVFWYYVKEVLNKHELQRFYSLKTITTDIGRGRAWLRCALNEHSLERYVHMLLADKNRLSVFYEDWSFMMDEERSSMIPTMAAGLNSILFAINIDNRDLNGQSKCAPTVSDLLKESTQNVTSLLKESTQGVSSLLREITASSAVSILIKPDQDSDPLPVLSKNVNAELKYKKDRKKKKKVANIISFDEENDELNVADATRMPVTGQSSEENLDRSSVFILPSSETSHGKNLNGNESNHSWKSNSVSLNGEYEYQKLDVKSIDDEDADEDDLCGKTLGNKDTEVETESSEKPPEIVTCNSQICSWTPLQVLNYDSDVLFPVSAVDSYSQTGVCIKCQKKKKKKKKKKEKERETSKKSHDALLGMYKRMAPLQGFRYGGLTTNSIPASHRTDL